MILHKQESRSRAVSGLVNLEVQEHQQGPRFLPPFCSAIHGMSVLFPASSPHGAKRAATAPRVSLPCNNTQPQMRVCFSACLSIYQLRTLPCLPGPTSPADFPLGLDARFHHMLISDPIIGKMDRSECLLWSIMI